VQTKASVIRRPQKNCFMEFPLVSLRGGYFTASGAEKEVSLGREIRCNAACCCMIRKSEQAVGATQLRHRYAVAEEEIGGFQSVRPLSRFSVTVHSTRLRDCISSLESTPNGPTSQVFILKGLGDIENRGGYCSKRFSKSSKRALA
jgi:hypothetical protein